MNWKKFNIGLFCSFVALLIVLPWLPISGEISGENRPWMLSPGFEEDSLTSFCKNHYELLKKYSVVETLGPSEKKNVFILVDAWGVPVEDSLLINDFAMFDDELVEFKLHKRLANRNVHAENTEIRDTTNSGMFLFGGDSLEYGRKNYIPSIGYKESIYCQDCGDSTMLAKLDSVLALDLFDKYAWTTQTSREGDRTQLHVTLKMINDLAKKHPGKRFVVQGTHRPILGTPETRRMYHPHWVPVVVINGKTNSK